MKFLFGSVVLLAMSLGFVACSDDDDNEPKVDKPAEKVAGTYTGTVSMVFAYGSLEYENKTVTLTANGDYAVDIAMDDEDLGVVDMKNVPVERNDDGSVSIVETEGVLSMPNHSGGMSDYACLVSGNISGDHSDYTIIFNVPSVMGGTTYTLTPAKEE